MKKIALFIAAVISAPAMAWTNGDITKELNFGGSITPEPYSQLWRWKVGTGLNDFRHNISDMSENLTKLTITMGSPKGLLYGETVKAITASKGMGAIPNIAFSDYENQSVSLKQGSSDGAGKGHMILPIKDEKNNKIGTLKVNVTAAGIAVGPDSNSSGKNALYISVGADKNTESLYGGLFSRSIANGYTDGHNLISSFGGKARGALLNDVKKHPLAKDWPLTGAVRNVSAYPVDFKTGNNKFVDGIASVSYVLGIAQNQKMEATFDNPVTATTKWSAPLNVAVTYN